MIHFTYEELYLISLYDRDNREGTIESLQFLSHYKELYDTETYELIMSTLDKLESISDAEFLDLNLLSDLEISEF